MENPGQFWRRKRAVVVVAGGQGFANRKDLTPPAHSLPIRSGDAQVAVDDLFGKDTDELRPALLEGQTG